MLSNQKAVPHEVIHRAMGGGVADAEHLADFFRRHEAVALAQPARSNLALDLLGEQRQREALIRQDGHE